MILRYLNTFLQFKLLLHEPHCIHFPRLMNQWAGAGAEAGEGVRAGKGEGAVMQNWAKTFRKTSRVHENKAVYTPPKSRVWAGAE